MKPLKIKMTAFGPYKEPEVIDFTELKHNRLFVVSGNTGSGKTTIFDAICFSLYGSASGEDRNDNKMLRSDFADDDTFTCVEFEFELRGRLFRVLREIGHIKQGNKSASIGKIELFERVSTGEIPCVEKQSVTEVNKKIEEIIGLSKDQFNQIVMLPQGEFRKLLTSQTENKEEILRRIFKTNLYKQVGDKLKEKRDIANVAFTRESQARDNFVNSIESTFPIRDESTLCAVLSQEHKNMNQIISGLEGEELYYTEKIAQDQSLYEKAYSKHDKKNKEYHEAKAINEQFEELEQKHGSLKGLIEQETSIKEKEEKLEKAERASNLGVYEKQVKEWRQEEEKKQTAVTLAETNLEKAQNLLEETDKEYKLEEGKSTEREEIRRKHDQLLDFLPKVKEINEKQKHLDKLQGIVEELDKSVKQSEIHLHEQTLVKSQLVQSIKDNEKLVDELPKKQETLSKLNDQFKVLQEYLQLQEKREVANQEASSTERDFQNVKEQYDQKEKAWFNGQAYLLASHLHEGEACQVCGSKDHPQKASPIEGTPTKEELEQLKKWLDNKDTVYRDAIANLKSLDAQVEVIKSELYSYDIEETEVTSIFQKVTEDRNQCNSELIQLNNVRETLMKQREELEHLEEQLNELTSKKTAIANQYQEQKSEFEKNKAVYENILESIPVEVRILEQLEKKIAETTEQKSALEKAWAEVQKRFHEVKETNVVANIDLQNAKKSNQETKEKKEKAEQQFKSALIEASFSSEEAYEQAKCSEQERQQLKETIESYKRNVNTLQQQVTELQEKLKDKTKVDILAYENEVQELKKVYEEALNTLNLTKKYKEDITKLKVNINESNEKVQVQEENLNRITDLYDMIRGQNSIKISFERYLQIEYLEQIIEVANERLRKLSNGQFYLQRSDRQESRGKQSGLGLDVYDAYTGQTRDVKTLSGGEKFNASLCLALGMADVIQSFQGGISIETMFIDEGFGSLDEESLNKSIDTLIDLQQSGRMIGVISHVQELKAAIPAILEVNKSKEGYSQTRFVIK